MQRRGFTLIEVLIVVAIICALGALITAAVQHAQTSVRQSAIKMEIANLGLALSDYYTTHGEYPPDFTNAAAVRRHLLLVFPRYDYSGDPYAQFVADLQANYNLDATQFDPASALAFWLGGLPERFDPANPNLYSQKPAGFHTDPLHPFRQGLPRTNPFYDFDYQDESPQNNRFFIQDPSGWMRYYPDRIREAPYVYFRARRDPTTARYEYGYVDTSTSQFVPFGYDHGGGNVARPYLVCDPYDPPPPDANDPKTVRTWRCPKQCQIISAGLDGLYNTPVNAMEVTPFRYTQSADGFTDGDYDNQANFHHGNTLEDEID